MDTPDVAIIPQRERDQFVELARSPSGRLFRKQILKKGTYAHPNIPGGKLVIDDQVLGRVKENFDRGVVPIVQLPMVDDNNRHSEAPDRNLGEVIDLEVGEDGLYGTLDVRKAELANEVGKTLLGISGMLHMDYTDTRSGQRVGPTLLHAAVTNRPYITDLKDYEEVIAASADTPDNETVVLTEVDGQEDDMGDRDELIATLRDEHGIDVAEMQSRIEQLEQSNTSTTTADDIVNAMSRVLADAGVIQLSGDGQSAVTIQDVAEAVIELSQEKVELASTVDELREENEKAQRRSAEAEIDAYIEQGRVLPKQRDQFVRLALEDREAMEALLPDDAVVQLSAVGVTTTDETISDDMKQHIERLAQAANEMRGRAKK